MKYILVIMMTLLISGMVLAVDPTEPVNISVDSGSEWFNLNWSQVNFTNYPVPSTPTGGGGNGSNCSVLGSCPTIAYLEYQNPADSDLKLSYLLQAFRSYAAPLNYSGTAYDYDFDIFSNNNNSYFIEAGNPIPVSLANEPVILLDADGVTDYGVGLVDIFGAKFSFYFLNNLFVNGSELCAFAISIGAPACTADYFNHSFFIANGIGSDYTFNYSKGINVTQNHNYIDPPRLESFSAPATSILLNATSGSANFSGGITTDGLLRIRGSGDSVFYSNVTIQKDLSVLGIMGLGLSASPGSTFISLSIADDTNLNEQIVASNPIIYYTNTQNRSATAYGFNAIMLHTSTGNITAGSNAGALALQTASTGWMDSSALQTLAYVPGANGGFKNPTFGDYRLIQSQNGSFTGVLTGLKANSPSISGTPRENGTSIEFLACNDLDHTTFLNKSYCITSREDSIMEDAARWYFGDNQSYINQIADGELNLVSDQEIILNSTVINATESDIIADRISLGGQKLPIISGGINATTVAYDTLDANSPTYFRGELYQYDLNGLPVFVMCEEANGHVIGHESAPDYSTINVGRVDIDNDVITYNDKSYLNHAFCISKKNKLDVKSPILKAKAILKNQKKECFRKEVSREPIYEDVTVSFEEPYFNLSARNLKDKVTTITKYYTSSQLVGYNIIYEEPNCMKNEK